MNKLTEKERTRYTVCKKQIADGLQTCFDTGAALTEIRDAKLYREDFDTFADFCQQTYQLERAHAYRMIAAAEIKMSPVGDKITNERQARAIAQVPENDRPAVLKLAAKTGEITAQAITVAAGKVEAKKPIQDAVEIRKDAIGREIPSDIIEDWDRAATVANRLRSCASEIKVTVERGLSDKDIIFAELTNPIIAEASGLHYTLSQIAPHAVCPACQGRTRKTCQLCRRRGWISKYLYNSPAVSSETKALLEKVAAKRK